LSLRPRVTVDEKGRIVIPFAIRKKYNLKQDSILTIQDLREKTEEKRLRMDGTGRITIPKPLRQKYSLTQGSTVEIEDLGNKKIVLDFLSQKVKLLLKVLIE